MKLLCNKMSSKIGIVVTITALLHVFENVSSVDIDKCKMPETVPANNVQPFLNSTQEDIIEKRKNLESLKSVSEGIYGGPKYSLKSRKINSTFPKDLTLCRLKSVGQSPGQARKGYDYVAQYKSHKNKILSRSKKTEDSNFVNVQKIPAKCSALNENSLKAASFGSSKETTKSFNRNHKVFPTNLGFIMNHLRKKRYYSESRTTSDRNWGYGDVFVKHRSQVFPRWYRPRIVKNPDSNNVKGNMKFSSLDDIRSSMNTKAVLLNDSMNLNPRNKSDPGVSAKDAVESVGYNKNSQLLFGKFRLSTYKPRRTMKMRNDSNIGNESNSRVKNRHFVSGLLKDDKRHKIHSSSFKLESSDANGDPNFIIPSPSPKTQKFAASLSDFSTFKPMLPSATSRKHDHEATPLLLSRISNLNPQTSEPTEEPNSIILRAISPKKQNNDSNNISSVSSNILAFNPHAIKLNNVSKCRLSKDGPRMQQLSIEPPDFNAIVSSKQMHQSSTRTDINVSASPGLNLNENVKNHLANRTISSNSMTEIEQNQKNVEAIIKVRNKNQPSLPAFNVENKVRSNNLSKPHANMSIESSEIRGAREEEWCESCSHDYKWGDCRGEVFYQHNIFLKIKGHPAALDTLFGMTVQGPIDITCVEAIRFNNSRAIVSLHSGGPGSSYAKLRFRGFPREGFSYIMKVRGVGRLEGDIDYSPQP